MAAKRAKLIAETDLYRPIANYLTEQGYTVRGEVHNCDVAAVKEDELIIIELKRALNIQLLAQAVDRQKITDSVYVGVPRPSNKRKWLGQNKQVLGLLKRLEVGLILIAVGRSRTPVEVISHPVPIERRKRQSVSRAILREIERRSGDFNEGGSVRKKLVTAYRENAIHIAACLNELGPSAPKRLRALGTGDNTLSILRANFYSWFERIERGIYGLSSRGKAELVHYPELVERYTALLKEQQMGSEIRL